MGTTEPETGVTFDPETDTYHLDHDWRSDESVSAAVVRGVAAVTDTAPTDLEPLFATLDPDALDQLYRSAAGDPGRGDCLVSFSYSDCAVTVAASGRITVRPDAEAGPVSAGVPRGLRDR
ncbi:HalOD1 output domain-containing protein [Halorussus sp. AFM4]|uniref:HalOD1 output domain-containing protein n=1 Tax=Halorussus sp. AFM4 TaxID=3421651 RepID=UPI003EBD9747